MTNSNFESEQVEAAKQEYFTYHACLTGDCPHQTNDACLRDAHKDGAVWGRAFGKDEVLKSPELDFKTMIAEAEKGGAVVCIPYRNILAFRDKFMGGGK